MQEDEMFQSKKSIEFSRRTLVLAEQRRRHTSTDFMKDKNLHDRLFLESKLIEDKKRHSLSSYNSQKQFNRQRSTSPKINDILDRVYTQAVSR